MKKDPNKITSISARVTDKQKTQLKIIAAGLNISLQDLIIDGLRLKLEEEGITYPKQ